MNKPDNKEDKLRVYEYAKSLSMSSKEIITILKRLNIPVNNHMSVMENDSVNSVEKFFRDIKANAAAKRASGEGNGAVQQSTRPTQSANPIARKEDNNRPSSNGGETGSSDKPNLENKPQATPASQAASGSSTSPTNAGSSTGSSPAGSQSGTPRTYNNQGGGNRQGGQQGSRQGQPYPRNQDSNRPQGTSTGGQPGTTGQRTGYQGSQPRTGGGQGGGYQGSQPRTGTGQGGYQGGQRTSSTGTGSSQGSGYQGGQRSSSGTSGGYQGGQRSGGSSTGGSSSGGQGGQRTGGGFNRPSGTGYSQGGQGGGQGGQRSSGGGSSSSSSTPAARPQFSAQRNTTRPQAATPNRFTDGKPASDTDGANRNRKSKPAPKRFEDGKGGKTGGRSGNRNQRGRSQQPIKEKVDNTPKKVIVRGAMTVGELAKLLHKDASEVIKKLLFLGVMATINQEIELESILLIADEFKVEVEVKLPVEEDPFEFAEAEDDEDTLIERPPVVTIMGHVDHGKTTLLDAIRQTNVTGGEAGGITQHIGAYQVETNHKKITFLDTPGHEAFTMMRARGSKVTDITILVVAADDGVMPQTEEAINHAKAANVPIIVAINKIDKPGANPEQNKQELTKFELVPEEWGGDTIFVNVSAKQRIGLEELLETILLVAEVQEYTANPNKAARATVIEAELDKGRGPVARVLVQQGTLRIGDAFVAGVCFGRIRAMVNDKGRRLKEAGPSTPIEITGLTEVPQAGDPFIVFEDERKAREIADKRSIKLRQSELGANTRVTLDDLYKHIKDGEIKDLNVIIKADVQGSAEALKGSLNKIEIEGVRVKILHSGVGAVTESDIILASASNAIIIGFNVRPESAAKATADQEKVDIRLHNVIYNAIEEIESAMRGMLDPVFKEVVIGHAEVRNLFKVSKVGTIAGCMVTSGKITRSSEARVVRSGIVLFQGKIDSLKRFKDDAKEVAQGYECGITLERFNDLIEGDVIEAFVMEKVER